MQKKLLMHKIIFPVLTAALAFSCNGSSSFKAIGSIEQLDPSLEEIITPGAKIEIIAEGFDWTEGPLWVESEKMLLFSDIPPNKIFKWTEAKGRELYLTPSGYTGATPRTGEPGSNGLLLNEEGKLVMCHHGDRRMAMMDAPLNAPEAAFISLADNYQGKKFNSPNDAVYRSNGDLFFTDPAYGLEKAMDDPAKEIPFQGVYKVNSKGEVSLLTDSISRPNGIAFTNNEKTLIVANSDPQNPVWYMFDIDGNDSLYNQRLMYDATEASKKEKGLPDGLKVDKQGNVFASGPGGIWVFNSEGKLVGKIAVPEACSNVALADNDQTLYITADMYVLRVRMRN
ncbi:MAG TPA: SMP-30/gluconolactonase/LRE family protein [Agriterribacter sp.]|nr:SMP-30/gluconolactonase/LRE family protein [Agriterribacter sp.]